VYCKEVCEQRTRNYRLFREKLGHVPFFCAELSFTPIFHTASKIELTGTKENLFWQKERLLNLLLEQLPSEYNKIAWVDTDIIFHNPYWYKETERLLDQFPLVQLWEECDQMNKSGEVINTFPSAANKGQHQGFAWAARREALKHGLYDLDPTGCADYRMHLAATGQFQQPIIMNMNTEWRRHFLTWAAKWYEGIKGRISCVPGSITHLYHQRNTTYERRTQTFRDFVPDDVELDDQGIWRWKHNVWIERARQLEFGGAK